MRSIASHLLAAAVVAAVALVSAACGGSGGGNTVVGTWQEQRAQEAMLIRLDDDGKWVADADGSLEDGVFTGGSYEVDGRHVTFTPSEGGICRGQTVAWDVEFPDDDTLDVDVVDGGCGLAEGRLTLKRVDGS